VRQRHSHFSISDALAWIERVKLKRAVITNMHAGFDLPLSPTDRRCRTSYRMNIRPALWREQKFQFVFFRLDRQRFCIFRRNSEEFAEGAGEGRRVAKSEIESQLRKAQTRLGRIGDPAE
jgi:hypothetical protein